MSTERTRTVGRELQLAGKLSHPDVRSQVLRVLSSFPSVAPIAVDLDPTSYCDLSCPGCISADLLGGERFTAARLERLAEELVAADVRAVVLIGGGEPLLHPRTPELARILAQSGVSVGLVTNGTLLGNVLDQLIESLSWLRVSLDAATASTYMQVRPGRHGANKFGLVIENIRAAVASGAFKVGISYVVCAGHDAAWPGNISEMAPAAELTANLACDYIEFKAELNHDHFIRLVSKHDLTNIRRQLLLARRALRGTPVHILRSSSLNALLLGESSQPKNYHWCPSRWLRTTITPSGMFVCAYHRGQDRFKVGDLRDGSFAKIWTEQGDQIVDPVVDCLFHCARHDINQAAISGIQEIGRADGIVPTDWFI
jgi:MoaA/NifB/PqqE/SkfB family radical SAM enzyme